MNEFLNIKNFEVKALKNREFEGYGSVFGNVDFGGDVVVKGAFDRSLKEHKSGGNMPLMFWMHKPDKIPGKWLEMEEDSQGLYVKGVLADTELGKEAHTLLGMKAVRGLSIGYQAKDYEYKDDGVRILKDVDLFETSIVSIAMNPLAEVYNAKSRLTERGEYVPDSEDLTGFKRDLEHYFRDKGFSNKQAKAYVSTLFDVASETLGDTDETSESKETEQDNLFSCVTPDEIEINEGIKNFEERQMLYEMQRIRKMIS